VLLSTVLVSITGCGQSSGDASPAAPQSSAGSRVTAPAKGGDAATAPPRKIRAMGPSVPVRLRIPAIGVDSALIPLGLQSDDTLQVPPNGFPAGWFTGAPTPGQRGPAVIAGHVHWDGSPGVFWSLEKVKPGDTITVSRNNGSVAVFEVGRVVSFPKRAFPSGVVYGNIDYPGLRLITCGGLNTQTGVYDDNTVVFARLVHARHRLSAEGAG
jgi:Sortase domain